PFWPKYNGRGAITANVGGQIYKDEMYDVYLGYRRKNLTTNAVDESVLYISRIHGLSNFDAPCVGQDPCDYTWTGLRYQDHTHFEGFIDVAGRLMRGTLKNASGQPVK